MQEGKEGEVVRIGQRSRENCREGERKRRREGGSQREGRKTEESRGIKRLQASFVI